MFIPERAGAYYLNLLWNWYSQPGLYRPDLLLDDPLIFGAANLLVGERLDPQLCLARPLENLMLC